MNTENTSSLSLELSSTPVQASRAHARHERGMTLIEIIVVIVILGVLIGFLTGSLFGKADEAKARLNRAQLTKIKGYIDQYRLENNSLPSSIEDLTRCNDKTGPGCIPQAKMDDLKDLFGTPLRYSIDNGRTYRLTSLGADAREGGEGANADASITGP